MKTPEIGDVVFYVAYDESSLSDGFMTGNVVTAYPKRSRIAKKMPFFLEGEAVFKMEDGSFVGVSDVFSSIRPCMQRCAERNEPVSALGTAIKDEEPTPGYTKLVDLRYPESFFDFKDGVDIPNQKINEWIHDAIRKMRETGSDNCSTSSGNTLITVFREEGGYFVTVTKNYMDCYVEA